MKTILSSLFLISFLAVLAIPTIISAAQCSGNCATIPSSGCECGGATRYSGYCNNNNTYYDSSNLSSCQASLGTSGSSQSGQQPIPTNVPTTPGELINRIEDIGRWIFTALLAIAVIFLVVAGFFFITAGGNPENINKARQMLINALIGVAVGVASWGLVQIIKNFVAR